MILRILGVGQYELDEASIAELNEVDDKLVAAVDSNDQQAFSAALVSIHEIVKSRGSQMPDDYLGPSELVLPDADATLEEIRELLEGDEDGLIPG